MKIPRFLAYAAIAGAVFAFGAPAGPGSVNAAGRTLRIGLVQQPNSLDPIHATEFYENYLSEALFSALVVLDDRERPSPDLALAVPTRANGGISADGKTLTYHLRPGVRWQDGVPLTAHDVVFTFAAMRDPQSNFTENGMYSIVDRVDAPDDRTVVVHMRTAWADATSELFVGGQAGSILPQHCFRGTAISRQSVFEGQPVGSGPYRLERWDRGSRIVLRASPNYFHGEPKIDRIEIRFVPNVNTLALALRTGQIDFGPQISAFAAAQLRDVARLKVRFAPTYSAYELGFNFNAPPVDDVRVRRALALAIDRKLVARTVFLGHAMPADDLVPPISPMHVSDPLRPASGDPAKAARLLDSAGWRVAAGGVRRNKDGVPLDVSIALPAGYTPLESAAIQLQAAWAHIGVQSEVRPVQSNALLDPANGILARGTFQSYIENDGYATTPDRLDRLGHTAGPPGLNYSRYDDPQFDRLSLAARATNDPAERRKLYGRISALVREAAPIEPLVWVERPYVYDSALTGLRPETVNSDLWNVYAWRWQDK